MNEGQSWMRLKGPSTVSAAFTRSEAQDREPDEVGLSPPLRFLPGSSSLSGSWPCTVGEVFSDVNFTK